MQANASVAIIQLDEIADISKSLCIVEFQAPDITGEGRSIMGLRVRKSIQICKGVRLNLGTTGASLSFGTKGLRHTIHTSGRRTTSVGIPGTGISYVKTHGTGKKQTTGKTSTGRTTAGNPTAYTGNDSFKVEAYNNLINTLRGIHKTCDEPVNWSELKNSSEPFSKGAIGPRQAQALQELNAYKPGFFQKLTSGDKRKELEKAVQLAAAEDAEDYENWQKLVVLADRVLSGDLDAYMDVIDQMNPLGDLVDFGTDFEFGADNPSAIEVEFKVKTETVVPQYTLSLTKTGKLSQKEMTKTAYYDLVQDFVCSCTIRIARDIFALLPVKTVVVHAVENGINTETGRQEEMTILSVLFERDILNGLYFENIDPSDAMNNFLHNMRFQKTAGFKPVARVENY